MKELFFIIKARILRKNFLNILIISMISFSIAVINLSLGLFNGFETRITEKITMFIPHLSVSTSVFKGFDKNISIEVNKIIKIRQLQALAVNIQGNITEGVLVKAISEKQMPDFISKSFLKSGYYPKKDSIIIGDKLARKLGVTLNSSINIITDLSSFSQFKIAGIFKTGFFDYDSSVIIIQDSSLGFFSPNSLANADSFYGVWLNNPDKSTLIASDIVKNQPYYEISEWKESNKQLVDSIKSEKTVLFVILSFLILISSLSISITQLIQLLNNKKQLGILTAIGFTPHKVFLLYSFEGVCYGFLGVLAGLLLTFIIALYLNNNPINLPDEAYRIENLDLILKNSDIVLVSILTILLSSLCGIISGVYASFKNPVEILREE